MKNMKRHVNYIASTVYGAVGGGGRRRDAMTVFFFVPVAAAVAVQT